MKKLLRRGGAVFLSLLLVITGLVPSNAWAAMPEASPVLDERAAATTLNFTVTESLSMTVEQGKTDITIEPCVVSNTGSDDLVISNVDLTPVTGWSIVKSSTDFQTAGKNDLGFTIEGHDFSDGAYTPNAIVSGGESTKLNLLGKLSAKADLSTKEKVTTCVLTVEKAPNPYLTFIGDNDFTLSTSKSWDGILEYSTDTTTWIEWDSSEITSKNRRLYLRGIGNTVISGGSSFVLDSPSQIRCKGNIETLLDYKTVKNGAHPQMGEYCYKGMFSGCTSLTTPPDLPATQLAVGCYFGMFLDCTGLTTAPELPATKLAADCYSSMFQGCTGLEATPELPATILADYCYSSMFYGCTGLTKTQKLPATTLAEGCYELMFYECANLTTAPKLPATELADSCYSSMFQDCTGLTTAPELPATQLADQCYYGMFQGCTGLATAPELPASQLADQCYYGMFQGCTGIEISETKTGKYQKEYRIPSNGEGTSAYYPLEGMFENTGGPFTGTPDINKMYYVESAIKIVSWADGTDEEIVAMVNALDNGEITVADTGWEVGDTRTVHLSNMSGSTGEFQAQDVELVIMHVGGYELANGKECNFVVGQKGCLQESVHIGQNEGNLNEWKTFESWNDCFTREWLNIMYRAGIPKKLTPIFKQFKTYTAVRYNNLDRLEKSIDYFALPAEVEVYGKCTYSSGAEFDREKFFQFDYLKTYDGFSTWERSPCRRGVQNLSNFYCVAGNGIPLLADKRDTYGLAPFGCI